MSRLALFSLRNFSDKIIYTFQTQNLYSIIFFENRYACEMMWKNTVMQDRTQMTIWRILIVYWIPKTISTEPEYVIIIALRLLQWLHESVKMFRYTCIACLFVSGKKR